ncbi:hypothetical protein [Butyricicoccus pullicaecorum]|uniref:hypothetical protein n=1 Tax=Butyricicoccus pullicaecorum TaxID=501571 RepID=UPI00116049A8|nr:hypothetical protein [Butyricicoccus pullicaecorum]
MDSQTFQSVLVYKPAQSGGKYWCGGERPLQMQVNEKTKTIELWLTRAEKNDPTFRASLKPLYQQYTAQKYLVAVFLSGDGDLYQQTRDLLIYNRKRLAEQEVQKQRQSAIFM